MSKNLNIMWYNVDNLHSTLQKKAIWEIIMNVMNKVSFTTSTWARFSYINRQKTHTVNTAPGCLVTMVSFQSTTPALLIVRKLPSIQAQNVQVPMYSQSCRKRADVAARILKSVARARKEKAEQLPLLFWFFFPLNKNNKKQRGSPMTSLGAAPDSLCAALSLSGPHSSPSRQRQAIQRPLNHDWSGNPFRNQWD